MTQIISKIIDGCALAELHKDKSKASQYLMSKNPPMGIEAHDMFYYFPQIPQIDILNLINKQDYTMGNLNYISEIDNGESNKRVTGEFRINASNPNANNVILLHGWRMKSNNKINNIYLKKFMDLGYNIYHYTMPYHGDRMSSDSLYSGELMVSANVDRTLKSIQQSVVDLRALIRWIRSKSIGKIVVIGISFGGYIANLLSTVDENIDMLISVFYANNLAYSIWNTIPGKYIKQELLNHHLTQEQLEQYWHIIDPSLFMPKVPSDNILLFSAKYDQYVDIRNADVLWHAWGKPNRILCECGHAGIVLRKNDIAKKSFEFVHRLGF